MSQYVCLPPDMNWGWTEFMEEHSECVLVQPKLRPLNTEFVLSHVRL
jgi:hypothetical protein